MTQGNEFKGLISMLNRAKLVKTLNFEKNNHASFLIFRKFIMDKIKNALTKNKNPPKKYKNSPLVFP
jgi:hypothetical protein